MSESANGNSEVNPQIVHSINTTQGAVLSNPVVKTSGAGKAFQSVAQSTAMAVQDATDHLRNLSTLSTTAIGVVLTQMIESGDVSKYTDALNQASGLMTSGADNFERIGTAAANVLNTFPSE